MYEVLDRLFNFIKLASEQWDDHQVRLEQVTAQLINMMRESRRPHNLQNEVFVVDLKIKKHKVD